MSAGYQVSVRRKSKMASVELRPLTVKVKSPDPRDSTNDQKSLPRADLLRQIPRLHPACPPCGLTLIGALIRLKIKLQCVSKVSKLKTFQRLSVIPRYNKFTKVWILVPSKSRIHIESELSIDEDNVFAISSPIVKGTS